MSKITNLPFKELILESKSSTHELSYLLLFTAIENAVSQHDAVENLSVNHCVLERETGNILPLRFIMLR